MKKQIKWILILTGMFATTVFFKNNPCKWRWISPNLCTIYDLPKEPPYFPRHNY